MAITIISIAVLINIWIFMTGAIAADGLKPYAGWFSTFLMLCTLGAMYLLLMKG